MILATMASVFLNGTAMVVGILGVMRLLYRFGICDPPRIAGDPPKYYRTHAALQPPPSDLSALGGPELWRVKWELSLAKTIPEQTIPISDKAIDRASAVIAGVLHR